MTSCGKYTPAEMQFVECWGRDVLVNVPDRYSGELTAKFYDPNGNEIKYVESYFQQLAIKRGEYFKTYIKQIEMLISKYCSKIEEDCTDELYHSCRFGFGKQWRNGLIAFTTVKPIETPDILFKINDDTYTIKWLYSPEDPYNPDEVEPYEYE
jgi:hypothetical protein